ncbi:MAG: hypothetical protein GXZ14_12665 [Ruminococcaceae bacterium]|nr:hypothetical protein [Oscillospiraceae bacterium]
MKRFFRKGSAEMVSIILGIVVIGGLALAVTGSFSKQGKKSFDSGLTQTTTQLGNNYNEAATMRTPTDPKLGVTQSNESNE